MFSGTFKNTLRNKLKQKSLLSQFKLSSREEVGCDRSDGRLSFTSFWRTGKINQRVNSSLMRNHSIGSSDGRCVQRAGTYSTRAHYSRLLGIPRSRSKIAIIYHQQDDVCKITHTSRWRRHSFDIVSVANKIEPKSYSVMPCLCIQALAYFEHSNFVKVNVAEVGWKRS